MRSPALSRLGYFVASSLLVLLHTPFAVAANNDDTRDVRLGIVQGDVRLSRGSHDRPDLQKPWEEALPNETISQGFALATGNGRASVDFEDGSTIYLAENSLLLLNKLSSNYKGSLTAVTLVTGTATFELKPQTGNRFSLKTPTDILFVDPPEDFHARIDAFLDATGITPQGEHGETLNRAYDAPAHFGKGESFYLSQGHIVEKQADSFADSPQFAMRVAMLCSPSTFDTISPERLVELCDSLRQRPLTAASEQMAAKSEPTSLTASAPHDFDSWVSARVQEKDAIAAAALKASGLPAPVPGLNELYQHGTFFECAPYGTCWRPSQGNALQQIASSGVAQVPDPAPQLPTGPSANQTFQPQTVSWSEFYDDYCGFGRYQNLSFVAHSQRELDELLRRKQMAAQRQNLAPSFYDVSCFQNPVFLYNDQYAQLICPTRQPVCAARDFACKRKHPPYPHELAAVRVNGKLGFLPRHTDDKKGKPIGSPRAGVLLPPARPGQTVDRAILSSSAKLKFEDKIPTVLQREFAPRIAAAPAPRIGAHFMGDVVRSSAPSAMPHSPAPQIAYDYKSQKFMMSPSSTSGRNERPFAVAGLSGNKLSTFNGSYSGHSGGSFDRSGNYSGRGGGYSGGGGGHYSGSSSGGSHSGGSSGSGSSHSYSGGSSSGGSSGGGSHYSGGGSSYSGSSSSSSGSSSGSSGSSSSGGGGRPH